MPRIITLYLIGQVTKISFLTLIVLFSVFFLNEFTVYLEKVSSGELYPELLILVSIYSMSEIVEVVLPLSVFIGTIIAIYRLDQNNDLLAFSKMVGSVAFPTIALTSNDSLIFWMSSLD